MKEYLIKINGAYKLCNLLEDDVTDEYIEIPEGATYCAEDANLGKKGNFFFRLRSNDFKDEAVWLESNWMRACFNVENQKVLWQRESPNDKLASAEQYRQAEVLSFIDDDFAESNVEQDNVNNPSHYADGEIECIDAIQSSMTHEAFCGYLKGNIQKYIWRYEKKGGIESLKKGQWYLDKLISVL